MTYSPLRAGISLASFLAVVAVLLPFYLIAFPFGNRARRFFAYPFYRACVGLTALDVQVRGAPANGKGTLYLANHVSYLDIPVLAVLADGVFVAKADVKSWPLFGFLARIGRTIFVSRQASKMRGERLEMAKSLADGEAVFLFPEGSSSDGMRVLPFRTGLLSAVMLDRELSIPVQPVSIAYGPVGKSGKPLCSEKRDLYAWYGEMDLLPHLWCLFGKAERAVVSVQFHPPRRSNEFANRHELARWAEHLVGNGVAEALDICPVADEADEAAASYSPPVVAAS